MGASRATNAWQRTVSLAQLSAWCQLPVQLASLLATRTSSSLLITTLAMRLAKEGIFALMTIHVNLRIAPLALASVSWILFRRHAIPLVQLDSHAQQISLALRKIVPHAME